MKKYLLLFISVMAIVFLVTGCKKGDTGPQGPKGTSNVMYSDWFRPMTYVKDTIFGVWEFNYTHPAAAITQAILDSGAVLTFGKLLGYNPAVWAVGQIGQLPITVTYQQAGIQNDTWSAMPSVGNLRIRFINDHNIYNVIANQHQFRYIIIPGGTPAGRLAQLSYKELCEKYNIPE